MKNKFETILFTDTPEKNAELQKVMTQLKTVPGALLQVLQQAQIIYGYLPLEVQLMVAKGLDVSLQEVYGVATFYSFFSLQPKGKYKISVCLGTACYVKGAGDIFDNFCEKLSLKNGGCTPDGKFSLEACRCIGACGLAPVLTVNDDVYGRLTLDDVDEILAKYRDAE